MAFGRHCENSKMCKTCVSLFGGLVLAQTIGFAWFLAYFFRLNAILSRARLPISPQGPVDAEPLPQKHGPRPARIMAKHEVARNAAADTEIGRASCREGVCQYV